MMKEEQLSHAVPNVAGILPVGGGAPITGKFEELVQRCAQVEGENAVLAYKLRRMRRTIRRLGQDNAFIQRRLRDHIRKREGAATTLAALAAARAIERPGRPPGEPEQTNHPKEDSGVSRGTTLAEVPSEPSVAAAPSSRTPAPAPGPMATPASNGHLGRTSSVKLETLQRIKKGAVSRNDVMTATTTLDNKK